MLNFLFSSIITNGAVSGTSFFICTLASLILGALIAGIYRLTEKSSKSFLITLLILPAVIQMVIMLVNGNIGAGVAVAGAFSLVRFRSVPGNGKEISTIFLTMAVGLATGMGYILAGALCLLFSTIYNKFSHGVTSPYMTYLCLFPLLLGAVPSLIFLLFSFLPRPGFLSTNLYQTGLSAITLSSAMRGIFEIAGTGSILQTILMDLGLLFLQSSIVVYIFQAINQKRHARRLSKTENK